MIRLAVALCMFGAPALAETVFAARTIPARSLIAASDIMMQDQIVPGAATDPSEVVGREARVALYAGRPIRPGDVAAPAIVERNEVITMIFSGGGLLIATEGRALDRAGPGEMIRVMNLSSRNTVTARIAPDGTAYVSQ